MQRNIQSVDLATGEVMQGALVWIPARQKLQEAFFMGFQAAFFDLAKDHELRGIPMAVLLALMSRLDFENEIVVSQAHLASELGIHPVNMSKAFRLLREKGLLEVNRREGIRTYRLNPAYAWRGRGKNLAAARRAHNLSVVK